VDDKSPWYYISRVTLSEAWNEFKGTLGAMVILGIATLVLCGIPAAIAYFAGADTHISSASSKIDGFFKSIPWWITAPAFISAVLWFARGQRIEIPRVDFKLWLIITIVQFVAFAGFGLLPWWVAAGAWYILTSPLFFLDRLIEIGRNKVLEEDAIN
jgi:hypothetical protein